MAGIVDGIKWGIILNLASVVILPLATRFLGTQAGSGGRPFGYDSPISGPHTHHGLYPDMNYPNNGYGCRDSDGYCGGGGDDFEGFKKKKKHHGGGGEMGPGGGYY